MTTTPEQIAQLIATNTALTQYFQGARDAIAQALTNNQTALDEALAQMDNRVTQAEGQMAQAILDLAQSHADVIIAYYDQTRHSLSTLNPAVDPDDDTKTCLLYTSDAADE